MKEYHKLSSEEKDQLGAYATELAEAERTRVARNKRVYEHLQAGVSVDELAQALGLSPLSIYTIVNRWKGRRDD